MEPVTVIGFLLTIDEVAEVLKTTPAAVRRLVAEGVLRSAGEDEDCIPAGEIWTYLDQQRAA